MAAEAFFCLCTPKCLTCACAVLGFSVRLRWLVDGMMEPKSARATAGATLLKSSTPLEAALARQLLEAVPALIYVYDVKNDKRVFQNRRLCDVLGRAIADEDEVDQSEWQRYIHPEDAMRFAVHRTRLRTIEDHETLSWEFRARHSDGAWRWFSAHDRLLETDGDGSPRLVVGNTTDITEQKASEQHKDIVLEELRHRARNASAVIEAIGRQSLPRGEPAVAAYFAKYAARLRALFTAGEVILSSTARLADLRTLLETALKPFHVEGEDVRIRIEGPTAEISEEMAGALALAVHELATNASKYGALSRSDGSVSLVWRTLDGRVTLDWKEEGGPNVTTPTREGYGARVIRHLGVRQPGGTVSLKYEPDG